MAKSESNRESSPEQEEGISMERDVLALNLTAEIKILKQAAKTKEDYEQLTVLYQKLEKLYESKERGQELEPWLSEQYDKQVEILQKFHILSVNLDHGVNRESESPGSIVGIDGKEYPLPSKSEIAELLEQNKELIEKKKEQGFTQLLITPFGIKLEDLIGKYKEVLIDHHQNNKLLATKKDPKDPDKELDLDKNKPVWVWDEYQNADVEGKLVYNPKEFSENHQGKTKEEILKEQGGWSVILMEDLPNIPRNGKGEIVGGRKQLEAGLTPKEYLEKLQTDPGYEHEMGMTPEEQVMYAIIHLEETDRVIDDYQGNGSVAYNIGGYFPSSDLVPDAYWYRGNRQADVHRSYPGDQNDHCGVRPAVRIKNS